MPYNDREKQLQYWRDYAEKYKDKKSNQNKVRYRKNKKEHLRKMREYYEKNKDRLNAYKREWYKIHQERLKKKADDRRYELLKEWLKILKKKFGAIACNKCGYDKCFASIEFHHLDPTSKEKPLARLLNSIPSEKHTSELNKGILLCANCHREVHNGPENCKSRIFENFQRKQSR